VIGADYLGAQEFTLHRDGTGYYALQMMKETLLEHPSISKVARSDNAGI